MKWQTYSLLLLFIILFNSKVAAEEYVVHNEQELQNALETAQVNDIVTIKAGLYKGNFTITAPLTIRGEEGATIQAPNKGDVLSINADDVTIENLQIEGSGSQNAGIHVNGDRSVIKNNTFYDVFHGVLVKDSYGSQIRENVITSYTTATSQHKGFGVYLIEAPYTVIQNNVIFNTNDGVYISYSDLCDINHNIITKARYGIHTMDSKNVVITENKITQSRNGLMIMQSDAVLISKNELYANTTIDGAGIFLFDTFTSTIANNILKKNNKGIYLENAIGNFIDNNHFEENDKGIEIGADSKDNLIYLNNFYNNNQQVISDKNNENQFNYDGYGNYWDDQFHLNLDSDDVTDFAYKSGDVFYHLTTNEPYLQIFTGSPAVRLWNTIEQFVPIPSKQFIVDESPLGKPVTLKSEHVDADDGRQALAKTQGNEKHGLLFSGFVFISFLTLWATRRRKNDA